MLIKPNSRFPCSELKTSTMKAQNTEMTNRLKTLVQTKKTRPTHMFFGMVASRMRKITMLPMKKRYAIGINRRRENLATKAENSAFATSMVTSVPVRSEEHTSE